MSSAGGEGEVCLIVSVCCISDGQLSM